MLTNATFAAVAERLAVPLASDVGRLAPTAPPDPSCTRKYWPGAIVHAPAHKVVMVQLVPVAEAVCTDQPVMSAVVVPRLNSSMKSFLYGAPEFPPPPNT